jgi:CRP-like cAMP-binding protein
VQSRTIVYHIAEKDFEKVENQGLRRATFGIENTLYFDTEESHYEEAYKILNVLSRLDFFRSLPVKKVQEFLSVVERKHFARGEAVFREGTMGDYFYIIESGNASIVNASMVRQKQLGAYEYFGEVALLTNSARTADIIADTDLNTLVIEKNRFLSFIAGTEFERLLLRLIERRDERIWNLMVESPSFARLTDYQRMWLESTFQRREFDAGATIVAEGHALPGIYLIDSGMVKVRRDGQTVAEIKRGETIGMLQILFRGEPARYTFVSEEPVQALFISKDDALDFVERNPGAAVRIETRYH